MSSSDEQEPVTVAGEVAKRDEDGIQVPATGGLMAITPEQSWWNRQQIAGLKQLGIDSAPDGDKAVFLHYCQKTGLDPFAKQIYMISRNSFNPRLNGGKGGWEVKWTIQTGIDGFRIIRDRAARRDRVTVEYEDTIWYDKDGKPHDVWLFPTPPTACRVVLLKDGRRFPAVLRTEAYMPTKEQTVDGVKVQVPTGQWKTQADHMIEKCCEAFACRRGFPQDLGGIYIEEEMQGAQSGYQPPALTPGPQRATRERPATPATVSGQVERPAEPVAPEPGTPGSQAADDPEFDRGKETRRMRALFGKAKMNGEADKELRLKLTGALAVAPGETALWLDSSDELTDTQLATLNRNLDLLQKECETQKRDFRLALEHIASAADAPVQDPEDGAGS